jgi:2-oxoglutarate ferredoxin oxidoreductase subunit beta
MTGGQHSPTTPIGAKAATARFGHVEPSFDVSELASTAGAAFVARTTVSHVNQMDKLLLQAVNKPGFALVEVLSTCHTNYGRQNRIASPVDMMKGLKERAVNVDSWQPMTESAQRDRFPVGVLVDRDLPTFMELYAEGCKKAAQQRAEGRL